MKNILAKEEMLAVRKQLKDEGKKVVFTNGCFDILHSGHIDYLNKAKALGDVLILGLNSDSSIKRIKGEKRPILDQNERAILTANLKAVDYVVFFDEDDPFKIISYLIPDILVKGADWALDKIIGRDVVEANGGEVKAIKFVTNQSTSNIIKRILSLYDK
ncbi:MAG: D-glycero-beta-D-manno-heptose 1-phosphate adenylyltransferase [Bacteroidota bacterium]|nr:D-glycero-beta-D-manno-heptose 1-phosphate adenylyltransferase [Bacteroidota bacterium]